MEKQLILFLSVISLSFLACNQSVSKADAYSEDKTEVIPDYSDIDVAAFKAKMSEQDVIVLDVRTPEEIAEGKIEGALEMDFYEAGFEEKVTALDREKTYLIYCRSGGRSGQTCGMMQKAGFKSLYNLEGGWTAWSN